MSFQIEPLLATRVHYNPPNPYRTVGVGLIGGGFWEELFARR